MATNNHKLNALEQEIVIQEKITVATEINRLELVINESKTNAQGRFGKLFKFTNVYMSIFYILVSLYVLFLILFVDKVGISLEGQKTIIILSVLALLFLPIVNILSNFLTSLNISYGTNKDERANRILLLRLENYYKVLCLELDPEKYKIWDDDYVIDIDESGSLIKYVRFYNDDGSVTTRPFKDLRELRSYLDMTEEMNDYKAINNKLVTKAQNMKLKEMQEDTAFNSFDLIDTNTISEKIVDPSNIYSTRLVNENRDFWPNQYDGKLSKWFSKDDFYGKQNFLEKLKSNILYEDDKINDKEIVSPLWINSKFESTKTWSEKLFFKNYDIQKRYEQTSDIDNFLKIVKNFDLKRDPAIDWMQTIDPKDIHKDKLKEYEALIREHEQQALDLSNRQIAKEKELSKKLLNVMKIELLDTTGIDVYKKYDPYGGIKKELELEKKRQKQISKTKLALAKLGVEDLNYDDLSISQMKKIQRNKIREAKELQKITKIEAQDELIKLLNRIKQLQESQFIETHIPNEKYIRVDGVKTFFDDDGVYYVENKNDEWIPAEFPADHYFNEYRDLKVKQLQVEYDELKAQKELELQTVEKAKNEEVANASRAKKDKKEKLKIKKKTDKLAKAEMAKIKKEGKLQSKNIKLQEKELSKEFEKQIMDDMYEYTYTELNAPNATFEYEGKYYYHDGAGNYFTIGDGENWIPAESLVEKSKVLKSEKSKKQKSESKEAQKQEALADKQKHKEQKQKMKEEKLAAKQFKKETNAANKESKKRLKQEQKDANAAQKQADAEAKEAQKQADKQAKEAQKENDLANQVKADDSAEVDKKNENDSPNSNILDNIKDIDLNTIAVGETFQDATGRYWYKGENDDLYYADESNNWVKVEK